MPCGTELLGSGLDPHRPPCLQVDVPRYNAMLETFDSFGGAGRRMLCSTASAQVSVDAGQNDSMAIDFRAKWQVAYALGPILVASFANLPLANSELTGWRSMRQATWMQIDPSRTGIPSMRIEPRLSWARYALDAFVICIRHLDDQPWTAPRHFAFRQWIISGWPRCPTFGDLRYHLTTLFPPVRPRGYLELRMIDAQAEDNWIVVLAVVHALLDDSKAVDAVLEITEPLRARASKTGVSPWKRAARYGTADRLMGLAATQCFEVALSSLSRAGVTHDVGNLVQKFADMYVSRNRCPADDVIECHRK